MFQTSLDQFFKKTKSSSQESQKVKVEKIVREVTPKSKRRLTPAAEAKQQKARAKANQQKTPLKPILPSPFARRRKRVNNGPKPTITLDDTDDEAPIQKASAPAQTQPSSTSSSSTSSQMPKHKRCLSLHPERLLKRNSSLSSSSPEKLTQNTGKPSTSFSSTEAGLSLSEVSRATRFSALLSDDSFMETPIVEKSSSKSSDGCFDVDKSQVPRSPSNFQRKTSDNSSSLNFQQKTPQKSPSLNLQRKTPQNSPSSKKIQSPSLSKKSSSSLSSIGYPLSPTPRFSAILSEDSSSEFSAKNSPKRRINFDIPPNPEKRPRTNEIPLPSQQLSNSKSIDVSKVSSKEINTEANQTTIIKEEVMLSDDDCYFESVDESAILETSKMHYLKVLPPEMINRKFDPHQNSQINDLLLENENFDESENLQIQNQDKSQLTGNILEVSPSTSSDDGDESKLSPYSRQSARPRRIFNGGINFQIVVENLNIMKIAGIPMNDFDLGKIYAEGEFEFKWKKMDNGDAVGFDVGEVVMPKNRDSVRLFEVISWVFSEPMYCGYFDEEERDIVYRIMCLRRESQVLLARMVKREIKWFRVRKQKYDADCDGNMEGYFMELAEKGFFDSDWENVDVDVIFNLLQVDELKELCKLMKMNHQVAKPKMIASLKQLLRQRTSHFSRVSPRQVLKSCLTSFAGPILKVSDKIISLINRIMTLYYPTQNPEEKLSDAFFMFAAVEEGIRKFVPYEIKRFPLFKNRQTMIDYVEAKQIWTEILQISLEKNKGPTHWEAIRNCGLRAYEELKKILINPDADGLFEKNSSETMEKSKPSVSPFSASYVWTKVLFASIDAFKKLKTDGYVRAKVYLEFLIDNKDKLPVSLGKVYKELTMIEMSHLKNLERSAELTLEAFRVAPSLLDQAEMMERARKLAGRAKGISHKTKEKLKKMLIEKEEEFICFPKENEIQVTKVDTDGRGKSLWQLDFDADKGYGSVENVALSHYAQAGFPNGIHCEGSLPVTLFACLFWHEIYELSIPGAFVAQFQRNPLDLFSAKFYENRRHYFVKKITEIEMMEDLEPLWDTMTDCFMKFKGFDCIVAGIMPDAESFHDAIKCLGKNGVLGICKKILFGGMATWKSGFPDLFVWNEKTGKCKIVEVKGPGDTLSIKQKLWIKYLEQIGVKVEVCLVKARQRC